MHACRDGCVINVIFEMRMCFSAGKRSFCLELHKFLSFEQFHAPDLADFTSISTLSTFPEKVDECSKVAVRVSEPMKTLCNARKSNFIWKC